MIYHLSEHIVLFKSEHIPLFCFKELFLEVVAQAMNDRFMFERHCFMLQFTAFETDKSVGQCILLFRRDILLIILIKSAKGITARLTTKSNVRFSSSARAWRKVTFSVRWHLPLRLLHVLFADTVYEVEFYLGKQDC